MPGNFSPVMASDVGERLRRQVAERAYQVCEYCLIHDADTFWGCQIDHEPDFRGAREIDLLMHYPPDEPGILRGRFLSEAGGNIYSKAAGKWFR